jgi:putative RecB family exonuclease
MDGAPQTASGSTAAIASSSQPLNITLLPAAQIRRFSPSALERFRTCPKAFWLADVERQSVPETPRPKLAQANAVHHALERFFGLPLEERSPAMLERALRAVWPLHRTPTTFADRDEEAAYGREALAMLARFGGSFDLSIEPLAREQWLSKRLAGGAEIFGKVDRIDALGEGLALIDYKTGARAIEDDALKDEPAAQIYAVAAAAAYDKPVEQVRFVYLPLGRQVVWMPELEDLAAIEAQLATLTREIRLRPAFEARPSHACRWCEYQLLCPERQRVLPEEIVAVEGLPF